MGVTSYKAGRFADALYELEAALVHPEKPLDAALSDKVRELIARARALVAIVQLEVQPASAEVTLDGRVVATGRLIVDRGGMRLPRTRKVFRRPR